MAKQLINRGTTANDGTGDNIRTGAGKVNDNFNEIYNAIGDGTNLVSGTFLTDTSTTTIQNKTISGANNTLTNIGNSSLSNSTVSYGGVQLSLGGSDATPAFNLADATGYLTSNLDGSITNAQLANNGIGLVDKVATTSNVDLGQSLTITGGTGVSTAVSGSTFTIDVNNISNSQLANSSISFTDDGSTSKSVPLGQAFSITGGAGISTTNDANGINITASGITDSEISGSAAIANTKLANSSITLGADTINLGDTQTTVTDLSIDGTGNINLTSEDNKIRFNYNGTGNLPAAASYEGMFAYDNSGNNPYVADAGGWVKLLSENSTVQELSNVNVSGIVDGAVLRWNGSQSRFNAQPGPMGMAQLWRLVSSQSGSGNSSYIDITNTFEECDDAWYNSVGPTLAQSSGVFTFGSTGLYRIDWNAQGTGANGDYMRTQLMVSTDSGSSYNVAALSEDGFSASTYANNNFTAYVDCTNQSTFRFKFQVSGNVSLYGATDHNRTHFAIMRIS